MAAVFDIKTRIRMLGIGLMGLLLACARPLAAVFLYNPWINAAILLTFLGGLILPFWFVQKLAFDWKVWRLYKAKDSTRIVDRGGILYPLLTNAEGQFKTAPSSDDTALILSGVERQLSERHTVSRYLVGTLILLGLLGTFIGLTQTVGSIAGSLKEMNFDGVISAEAFQQLKQSIQMPLSGMGVAFSSSIFGVIGSLILGVFDLQQSKAEKELYDDLENYFVTLDKKPHTLMSEAHGPAYVMALLEQTAENLGALESRLIQMEESHARVARIWQGVSEAMATVASQGEQTHGLLEALVRVQETNARTLKGLAEGQGKAGQAVLLSLKRLLDDAMTGRQQLTQDMRSEIRMVVKTLSLLSEPEDDFLAQSQEERTAQGARP